MADSNITKRALAEALKELLKAEPFSQISVREICSKCQMNRKSFYYHFKDKYDLVNWIYATEFIAVAKQRGYGEIKRTLLDDMCAYFYENRDFYRRVFVVEGQNSFTDYFRDLLTVILSQDMEKNIRRRRGAGFLHSLLHRRVCLRHTQVDIAEGLHTGRGIRQPAQPLPDRSVRADSA